LNLRITGAMGKGVAALTFDKDYQKSRRDALNKKPANLQEGLARSGKGLVMVSLNVSVFF
jgi:vacuolar protein sorting-associated protein 13A/C